MLAGHSQGGGHVGVLAKTVALSRAVYFSSPDDWHAPTDMPANCTSTPVDSAGKPLFDSNGVWAYLCFQ